MRAYVVDDQGETLSIMKSLLGSQDVSADPEILEYLSRADMTALGKGAVNFPHQAALGANPHGLELRNPDGFNSSVNSGLNTHASLFPRLGSSTSISNRL